MWRRMMTRLTLDDLENELRAVVRGEREPSLPPAASLTAALSREGLELMEILIERRPKTIAEASEFAGRAQPNVSRSLQQLERLGLVRLIRNGREVRPEPLASMVVLDLKSSSYVTQ